MTAPLRVTLECEPGDHTWSSWTSRRRPIPNLNIFYLVKTCLVCKLEQAEDE